MEGGGGVEAEGVGSGRDGETAGRQSAEEGERVCSCKVQNIQKNVCTNPTPSPSLPHSSIFLRICDKF